MWYSLSVQFKHVPSAQPTRVLCRWDFFILVGCDFVLIIVISSSHSKGLRA